MATVTDLLRHLGQHAAPDGGNALAGLLHLPGSPQSPLPVSVSPQLLAHWSQQTSRITTRHHALALSAAQTRQSLALLGHGLAAQADLLLVLLSRLQAVPRKAALCIVPPDDNVFRAQLRSLADTVGVHVIDAGQARTRVERAELVLASPSELHQRILRFHDRAWRWLWPQLDTIALPGLDRYSGVQAGHLHWLLRRVQRLVHEPLPLLVSQAPVADVETATLHLVEQHLRLINVADAPPHQTLVALWRAPADRTQALVELATKLAERGLAITALSHDQADTQQLQALLASRQILANDARVALVPSIPNGYTERHALLRAGYRLLIFLVGDDPHELLFTAQPELMHKPQPSWPQATTNPYIAVGQIVCAAAERPLEQSEIDRWQLRDLRDRLIKKGQLQTLPGADMWHTGPAAVDAYDELDVQGIGTPVTVLDATNKLFATLPQTLLDRVALPGQLYAPGLRVVGRDDDAQTVQLAPDTSGCATVVLADIDVSVREELAARTIHLGKSTTNLVKGKVLVAQRIIGLRELQPDGTQRRLPLPPVPESQWSANACWLTLAAPPVEPTMAGWSLTHVVPLIALARPADLVPAYSAEHQRLYFVEAEPGGIGLIESVYDQFEQLAAYALDLSTACASRPLYRQLATTELAWLQALQAAAAPSRPAETVPQVAQPLTNAARQPSVTVPSPHAAFVPTGGRARVYQPPAPRVLPEVQQRSHAAVPEPGVAQFDQASLIPGVDNQEQDTIESSAVQASFDTRGAADKRHTPNERIDTVQGARAERDEPDHYAAEDIAETQPTPPVATVRHAQRIDELLPPLEDEDEHDAIADQPLPQAVEAEKKYFVPPASPREGQRRPLPRSQHRQPHRPPSNRPTQHARSSTGEGGRPTDRPSTPQRSAPPPQRSMPSSQRSAKPPQHNTPAERRDAANRAKPLPPNRQPPVPEPAPPEPEADVGAMIARMRRLREQREAEQQRPSSSPAHPAQAEPVELRFHIGELVQCLPYGEGIVRASRILDGREQLLIEFPDYGEIEVDPAISLVRQLGKRDQRATEQDDAVDPR